MAAALRDYFGAGPVELRDVKILEALSIGDEDAIILKTTFDPISHRLRVSSLRRDFEDEWRLRAQAYGWQHEFSLQTSSFDPSVLKKPTALEGKEFYELMSLHGLEYGPKFRAVQRIWLVNDEHLLGWIESDEAAKRPGFFAFPGLLDSVLQSGLPLVDLDDGLWNPGRPVAEAGQAGAAFPLRLPVGFRKILIAGSLPSKVVTEFRARKAPIPAAIGSTARMASHSWHSRIST